MTLNKSMKVIDLLSKDKLYVDVLRNFGFNGLDNPHVLKQVGDKTIEELFSQQNKDVNEFIKLIEEGQQKQVVDVTLEKQQTEGEITIKGLLPCPVRVPLLDAFSTSGLDSNIGYELKAASEGLDWLQNHIHSATEEDELADLFISAGFDLFFEKHFVDTFKNSNTFEDYNGKTEFNSDFNNERITLQDPKHHYSMISVVPAVFLVNTNILGDRPTPQSWEELMDPIYENSVSLPMGDFDLFNAILIHIYKEYGFDGIKRLRKQLITSMHPAQMVKSDKRSRVKPAVSIMPYFFTKMALPGSVMKAVWPTDGAIASPIFILSKSSKKEQLKPIVDFFQSKEVGEILSHKGLFPSVNPEVDNKLTNNTFKWVGWDYIYNNDIGSLLHKCLSVFNEVN